MDPGLGFEAGISWFSIGAGLLTPALIVATAVAGVHIVMNIFLGMGDDDDDDD